MRQHRNAFKTLVPLTALWLHAGLSPAASAQASVAPAGPTRDTSADNELLLADEPIVVTATKTSERLSDSPAAVTVITEEDIRRSAAKTVPDLLRSVPGVDVFAPNQSQQNISIRGFNGQFSNTLLVMVDGRPIYYDFYGTVFWNQEPLLLSRIKRIEIVRGPGSALYGANAFGGVINILTKTPQEMAAGGTHADAVVAHGEQDSTFAEANVAGQAGGGWSYAVGGGYHATDGDGGRPNGNTVDTNKTPILMADAQKALPDGSLRLSVSTTNAKTDYDSIFLIQGGDWRNTEYAVTYDADRERNPVLVRAFAHDLQLASTVPGTWEGRAYGVDMQQQRDLSPRNRLVYGLSYRDTSLVSSFLTSGQRRSRVSWSGFAQDEAHLAPQTSLFAGVRVDNNSLYGTNVSPRVSLVHHLADAQTLRLSYATAFRAPTLLEDYFNLPYPIIPGVLTVQIKGNPDLKTEELQSLEAGYRRDLRGGYIGAALFTYQITGLIAAGAMQYAPSPPFPAGVPTLISFDSIGSGRATGLELEGGFGLPGNLRGEANYSYQDVTEGGQRASMSPRNKANLTIETRDDARLSFRSDFHYVDSCVYSNQFASGTESSVGAYVRADLKIGYRIGSASRPTVFSLAATNLLGDGHREFPNVPSPLGPLPQSFPQDRTVWLGVETRL